MSAGFQFGPLERRGVFLGLRSGQLVVGVAATVAVVGVFSLWPSAPGAIAALGLVVIGAVTVVLPVAGRPVDQWIAVVARHLATVITGTRTWLGPSHHRGHDLLERDAWYEVSDPLPPADRRMRKPARQRFEDEGDDPPSAERWVADVRRVDGGDALPPYLAGMQILAARWRQGDLGVLKDVRRRTYVGVIAARGRSFTLLDEDEKERLLAQWGSVLANVARESGVVTRVQWLERAVPDDSEAVMRHLRENRALPASSPFVTSYLALVDDAAPQTQQHEVFIALQVSAVRASSVIRQLREGVDVGACEVLSRELDAFAANLRRADIEVRGSLGPRMLAAVLRQAADPPAREQLAHRTAANPDTAGASPRNAFPRRSVATWSTFRTEGAWHATYWVSEWPRAAVDGDWMAPLLLGTRSRRSVSVVMEPVAPALALRRVEATRIDDETTQSLRQRFGFRKTVRKRREEENVERAEEELNEGHCAFRFSAYISVTARTERELDAACADVEQQARQSRLDVRREYGLQDVAFTYTLPLCRGLQ